jgi:valyl-tRNA synthetase
LTQIVSAVFEKIRFGRPAGAPFFVVRIRPQGVADGISTMMDKTFDPSTIEAHWAAEWEKAGAFKAGRVSGEPFTIVIPPPNVTGSLHMGHALNNTLQDILCRYWRMKGRDVLWQPGTDHAGIATQMVVERQMLERQEPNRHIIGREAFLDKVWAWKEESGGTIINQLKRLGASCDWSRERFTMGNRADGEKGQMQRAVLQFFVTLHEKGLLYKAKRLVNWDPKLLTAISDLEVEQREVKGSFAWHRGERDKEGNPKPFSIEALGKVLAKEPGGHLYYFDYPIEGESYDPSNPDSFIQVATTRPETMLGDTAVAVHPENERLKHLIGRHVRLPLVGRLIPIVADDYADPEKGTGAVKITPAHDFNDFEVGKRHGLPVVNMMNREAAVTLFDEGFWESTNFWDACKDNNANMWEVLYDTNEYGEDYSIEVDDPELERVRSLDGMPRFAARVQIVAMMESEGYLAKIEVHAHQVPHGDRSGVPIEPWLSDQWYVDVKPLAEQAMEWVREGKTKIYPANREADFFRWLENIQPWNISRQLWWGHQIPAWYGPTKNGTDFDFKKPKFFVADTESEAFKIASEYYACTIEQLKLLPDSGNFNELFWLLMGDAHKDTIPLYRDPDVLDTWFSSALWPFSTMGWPDDTAELARYYPGSVLVTAADILFFWVARMMMASAALDHHGKPLEAPFADVYLHGLVRDEKGRKMSKSVGNVLDPLVVIDTLGADALRFTIASFAAQGRDPKLGVKTAESYRNFCTKLWNASRFAEMNECRAVSGFDPKSVKLPLNRWIMGEADKALAEIEAGIEGYKFNEAALAAYRFTWNIVCDWYLELAKPVLQGEDSPQRNETRAAVASILDRTVAMLHPFMPFITEELNAAYGVFSNQARGQLCTGNWPVPIGLADAAAEAEIGFVVDLISEIRSARAEMNVPVATLAPLVFVGADAAGVARAKGAEDALKRMARVSELQFMHEPPPQSVQIVVRGQVACLPLGGLIDFAAEKKRLTSEREKLAKDMDGTKRKLDNPDFVARAPEEVIEENRERLAEAEARIARIDEALKRLG